jgi:predicted metal-dependent hydrolase
MTALKIRKLPWSFGPDTPFQWNPANPLFGLGMNTLSFLGPPFERYIVLAVREAMREIADPAVREEADAFVQQEGLHAAAHRRHVNALVAQYPGLSEVSDELDRSYDALLRTQPLHYHLAYIADIEATFTPLFSMFFAHKATMFDNGDPRVAPLFLWHFTEEIEHRASAQILYDAVVKSPWYRLRVSRRVFAHMAECANVCGRGFNRHVPREIRLADAMEDATLSPVGMARRMLARSGADAAMPAAVPGPAAREIATLLFRLLRSQTPWHQQVDEPVPPFADEWLAAYDAGRDVVDWYAHPEETRCPT